MVDAQKTGYCSPLIDLTNDDASSSNHIAPHIDLTESDDRGTNHSPDVIDLTDDDFNHVTPNIPVIDLTGDNHFLNYRIPLIDLTDDDVQVNANQTQCIDLTHDDVQVITNQTECIDLTYNDATSSNHSIQNSDLGGIDDGGTNRSTKLINLTHDDIQDFNPNAPVIDLTCDDDQFVNFRIRCTDTTNDDVQDVTHQLQNFDLTDGEQPGRNDWIPTMDLKNYNTDRVIPVADLASEKDCNNDKRQIIDMIRNDDRVIRKPIDDVEMYDLSCNNSHASFPNNVIENNIRIPDANLNYIAPENDFLNYNKTVNLNAMHTDTFSKFPLRNEHLANHALKNFEYKKEISLTSHSPRKDYDEKIKTNFTNHPLRKNFEDRVETVGTNHPPTNNSEEKCLSPRKSEKIFQDFAEDFMKPARHPIPLRHSLGRSTVSTSKNVPIECTEASEDESRLLTVSSVIHRKKSKPVTDISTKNVPKLQIQSTSRENTFSFETLKRIFLKFWIFLLTVFIGLYYWL